MRKINRMLFLLIFLTSFVHNGSLIVLHGSSRSGKTSVQKALLALDSTWTFIDQDEKWGRGVAHIIERQFSQEYLIISNAITPENFFHAVERNLIIFKPGISQDLRDDASAALIKVASQWHDPHNTMRKEFIKDLRTALIQEIISRTKAGEKIVADLPFYYDLQEQLMQSGCAIFAVLLYCPFSMVIERLERRNKIAVETGDLREHRLYSTILQQYLGVYQACTEQDAIGYLDYRELSDCFEIIRNSTRSLYEMYMLDMPHFSREYSQDQLLDVKNQFLQQFDLHEGKRAYIKPKLTYDLTIDTTYAAPEDIALQILERFAGNEANRF